MLFQKLPFYSVDTALEKVVRRSGVGARTSLLIVNARKYPLHSSPERQKKFSDSQ